MSSSFQPGKAEPSLPLPAPVFSLTTLPSAGVSADLGLVVLLKSVEENPCKAPCPRKVPPRCAVCAAGQGAGNHQRG